MSVVMMYERVEHAWKSSKRYVGPSQLPQLPTIIACILCYTTLKNMPRHPETAAGYAFVWTLRPATRPHQTAVAMDHHHAAVDRSRDHLNDAFRRGFGDRVGTTYT